MNTRNKTSWSFKILKPEENKEDIKTIEGIFPEDMRTNEIKNEIYKIKNRKRN